MSKFDPYEEIYNNQPGFLVNDVDQSQERMARQTYQPAQHTMRGAGDATKPLVTTTTSTQTRKNGGGGSYTVNAGNQPYIDQLNALYDQIMNRGPFQYDLTGDMLYRQAADQYTQLGQQAMRDAMGQAAGLTGGYGNSYGTTAGNQAYQQYLTALNEQIPSYYDRALQAWQMQGDELMRQYQFAASHPGTIEALKPRTYSYGGGGGGTKETTEDAELYELLKSMPSYNTLLKDYLRGGSNTTSNTDVDLLGLPEVYETPATTGTTAGATASQPTNVLPVGSRWQYDPLNKYVPKWPYGT